MNPYLPVLIVFLATRILSYSFMTVATEPELYYQYAKVVHGTSLDALYRGTISRPYPFTSELQTQPPEYPQLTALFLTPPIWLAEATPHLSRLVEHRPRPYPPKIAAYEAALGLQLFMVDALLLWLVYLTARILYPDDSRGLRAARLGIYVAASAIFMPVWFDRLDTVIGVFVTGAILAFAKGGKRLAYLLLVLGSGFKLVPLFLLPLWVMAAASQGHPTRRAFLARLLREAATASAMLLVGIAGLYLLGGGDRAFVFLTPHAARGIQPESSYGPLIVLGDSSTQVVFNYGGFHLSGSLANRLVPVTTFVLLALISLTYLLAARALLRRSEFRASSSPFLPCASILTLLAFILGGKVASPQYTIWLMPLAALVPLATSSEWRWTMWFLALCGVMTLLFPLASGQVSGTRLDAATWAGPTAFGLGLVIARAILLAGLAWWRARSLGQSSDLENLELANQQVSGFPLQPLSASPEP